MAHLSDDNPDVEALLARASSAVPGLVVRDVEVLTNGWDNVVLKVNSAWIFRFRRGPAKLGLSLDTEVALLSALAGKTRMAIPRVIAQDLQAAVPYVVYPLLSGGWMPSGLRGPARAAAVADISSFLADVHAGVTWQRATALGVDAATADPWTLERGLRQIADRDLRALVANAAEFEARTSNDVRDRVLLHNDVHHRNVAWNESTERLAGIFDFGDARVGDFHREFAPLYELEPPLGRDVAAAYGALTGRPVAIDRIAAYTVLRIVDDMVGTATGPTAPVTDNTHVWLRELAERHPDLLAGYRAHGRRAS